MKQSFESQRESMVRTQLRGRGIRDKRILEAFGKVRRERFVPEAMREHAYADRAIPLDDDGLMAPPYVTALMLEAAGVSEQDRVLEVGTGTGYTPALLRELGGRVTTITRHAAQATGARERLAAEGYEDVHVVVRDGTKGFARAAPFDAVVVSEAGPEAPDPLIEQLEQGGRLVMALGPADAEQTLYRFFLDGYEVDREELGKVQLPPLLGKHGFPTDRAISW